MQYKLGLIGENISYTLSPLVHNAIFRYCGIDATFEVFDVPHGDFVKTAEYLKKNLDGFNVTKPYKTEIIPLLDADESGCGAVNTVKCGDKAVGYNTDGFGFIKSFTENLPPHCGRKVLILGAGGAAREVVKGLKESGFDVYVHNRTESKRDAIVADFGVKPFVGEITDTVVNCTSFGLRDGENPAAFLPFFPKYAFDLIYNPRETDFLKWAKSGGAVIGNGTDLLIYQAVKSDSIILGLKFTEVDYENIRTDIEELLYKKER